MGKTPPTERARLLHALADAIVANRKELAELESRNVGKAISSVKAEVAGAVENFRFFASVVGSISGRSQPFGGSLMSYTLKEPVGVCAQIVPWNYPLLMSVWKLSPALAAGCSVVLKPDPQTPLSVLRIAELASEVGFPAGAINIVPADGPTTGSYLVQHPGVDKVAFTGSTATGSAIMKLAADGIKRLTLELGGKSPNVVFADANLDDAIPSSVWSIYYAAGQSCEARSRVLVEASIYDEFVAKFAEHAKSLKVGDPLDAETQVGSLISTAHRDRVHGMVEAGVKEGAEVVAGGEFGDGAGAFYLPTVLAGVDNSMTVAQEEIFGPVVTVDPVRGREGRDPHRERRPLRPIRDGLDGRPGARPSRREGDQVGDGRDQHAVHRVPRHPVRRLQAVGLRPRAVDRHARPLSRDEGRALLHEPEALQSVRALVRRSSRRVSRLRPSRAGARASRLSETRRPIVGLEAAIGAAVTVRSCSRIDIEWLGTRDPFTRTAGTPPRSRYG